MATIVASSVDGFGTRTITETTLTGTLDTFTYREGVKQTLIFRNPTAGALSPILDGAGSTTVAITGIGTIDLSAGFPVGSIPIGGVRSIRTESVGQYLLGTIAITGGTGLVATLIEG